MVRWEARLRESASWRDRDLDGYLELCVDYLKRQMVVYENWPQRRYAETGYSREKVFTDMNA